MLTKYPKKAIGKWKRYNSIEKGFIFYCLVLIITIHLPLIEFRTAENTFIGNINLYSSNLFSTYIVFILSIIFLIVWNTSFRFKNFFQMLTGFKDNEAIVNFGILWVIAIGLLSIGNMANTTKADLSFGVNLIYGYYLNGILLVIGLIWTLILALNFSKSRKKTQLVNIIQNQNSKIENKDTTLMGLFDTEKND